MRWKGRQQSQHVDDRRGRGGRNAVGGGLGLVVMLVLAVAFRADPIELLSQVATQGGPSASQPIDPAQEPLKEFTSVTLADTERVWNRELPAQTGRPYREPTLVLFSGSVQSACGMAGSAVGPFYCPGDEHVYIDLSFYGTLRDKLGARGDFAQAYVIAHEVGHHVQQVLGTMEKVHARRGVLSEKEANALTVRLELQADFYAGVWAHHAQEMAEIDQEDVREAIEAAQAIGDDRLQMRGQGYVVPDAFTHGTSEQRTRWFLKGWKSGLLRDGDTFGATRL